MIGFLSTTTHNRGVLSYSVYRAHDTVLHRDVALKLLPDRFASDADRLSRFQREAQVLASLNHPGIAQIYGLEGTGASRCIVMELIEGETLEERLRRGALGVEEALPLARQIAEAIEAAHERGIIHRDLKPANIKLTPDGRVKVLDFGLAKALNNASVDENLSNSPTISMAATQTGIILGTAPYMSPEQAKGKESDRMSDVWAFGCVLYEMLTGVRLFDGDDIAEVLAAVVRGEPDFRRLPAETPPAIRRLLRRSVVKDRTERLPDIGIARLEIKDALITPVETATEPDVARRRELISNRQFTLPLAVISLLLALALGTMIYFRPLATETWIYRSSILPPDTVGWAGYPAQRFALSPDGRRLAFLATDPSGRTQVWLRALDESDAKPLAGTEGAATMFWSPDSRYIGFGSGGKLRKIDASGGPPVILADFTSNTRSTWSQDGVILFTPTTQSPIHRISASGGTASPVTTLNVETGDSGHWHSFFLPDGRHFLYLVVGSRAGGSFDTRGIYVGSLDPNEKSKLLLDGGSNVQYAAGHLLFMREASLMAQPFDEERLELSGEAVPVAEHVQIGGATGRNGAFSVSQTGVLVYQTGIGEALSRLIWVDRNGKEINTLGELGDYGNVELSPAGTQAIVSLLDPVRRTRDLWTFDLARSLRTRLTFDPSSELGAVWSPDSSRIAFDSQRQNGRQDIFEKAASGVGEEASIGKMLEGELGRRPSSWSSNGQYLLYETGIGQQVDLWVLPFVGERRPFRFLGSTFDETRGQFSPDGRWVAYTSTESGRPEVYVVSFPEPRVKVQVSTSGGSWSRWRRDGKEIFYLSPDNQLMTVAVTSTGSRLEVSAARPLFETRARTANLNPYDVSADGQRFLINTLVETASSTPITLLVNWPAALKN